LLETGSFYFALTRHRTLLSRQREKFLYGQSRKFLLRLVTLGRD
jgi:hypothetical protein